DFLFIKSLNPLASNPSFSIKNGNIAASISPHLVPIINPSRGVNPILVSTDLPHLLQLQKLHFLSDKLLFYSLICFYLTSQLLFEIHIYEKFHGIRIFLHHI